MSKQSRLLAVDASVLRAAGTLNSAGYAGACAHALQDILSICHRVVITTEVLAEWTKHQSDFSKRWRASMAAKKKLKPLPSNTQSIQDQINLQVPQQNSAEKRALRKDAHLLAAALAADRVLLTADHQLHDLCRKHGVVANRLEWLKLLPADAPEQKQNISARLRDLATTRPHPPLPKP